MKHPNSTRGKLYRFISRDLWGEDAKRYVHLPKKVVKHMVLVVDSSDVPRGWVKVATITSTFANDVDPDLYVPIHPTRKNRRTNMQLKLSDDPIGTRGLYYAGCSFLRVDALHEVPMEILEPQISHGRHLELKEQSYRGLIHFLKQRQIIQPAPRPGAYRKATADFVDPSHSVNYVRPVEPANTAESDAAAGMSPDRNDIISVLATQLSDTMSSIAGEQSSDQVFLKLSQSGTTMPLAIDPVDPVEFLGMDHSADETEEPTIRSHQSVEARQGISSEYGSEDV